MQLVRIAVSFAAFCAGLLAQGQGVVVVRTQVRAVIDAGVATTTIEQVFANRGDRPAEGLWLLPVPEDAVADSFKMIVGGREMIAEVLDQASARNIYETIVRQRRDPGLLEYVGQGLLRARVFPIPPQGEIATQVRLRQSLALARGLGEWRLPLRALRLGEGNEGPIGVDIVIKAKAPLKTVLASRPDAEVRWHGEREAHVSFEIAPQAQVERELTVLFGLAESEFGLHAVTYRRPGEDGWFAMFVSPRRELPPEAVPPRCVQFAIDTSGSMQGKKMEQAKAALRAFLATLRPIDRFQIVPFATEAQPFFAAPRRADAAALDAALLRIDRLVATGGTNIHDALVAMLDRVAVVDDEPGLLLLVVFVTDGLPTIGVTDPNQLLADVAAKNTRRTRVFVLGVGDDLNRDLLADLAHDNRGSPEFVGTQEAIDQRTAALCARIAQPALTDVVVACDGCDGFETNPRTVPDLFAGDTLEVVGRYRGTGVRDVVLRGNLAGKPQEYRFPVEFPALDTGHDFVPVTWARRQIRTLLAQMRRTGPDQELVAEVGRLAREFGITTPYTSPVIVEEGLRLAGRAGEPNGGKKGAPGGPCGPSRGSIVGGPGLPSTPGPSAPGPSTPGPSAPPPGGGRGARPVATGSDEFYLGGTRRADGAAATTVPALVTQRAAGRTFLRVGERWLEVGLPSDWEAAARRVIAYGDDYFALLAAHPELRAAFALGSDVVLRVGDGVVRIATA